VQNGRGCENKWSRKNRLLDHRNPRLRYWGGMKCTKKKGVRERSPQGERKRGDELTGGLEPFRDRKKK